MTDPIDPQAVALFRYGLIAEFLHRPPNQPGLYQRLRHKASQDYQIPGSLRQRVAAETLRHWIKDYKRGGIDTTASSVSGCVTCWTGWTSSGTH